MDSSSDVDSASGVTCVTGVVSFENLNVEGPKEHELDTMVEVKVGRSARATEASEASVAN